MIAVPTCSAESAYLLTKVRTLIATAGSYGLRSGEDGIIATAALPGGFIARFTLGRGTGQLFYPTGRPLSTEMALDRHSAFASFMHNLDVSIAMALPGFRMEGLALADVVGRKLMRGELEIELPEEVNFPDHAGHWLLQPPAREFLAAAEARSGGLGSAYERFIHETPPARDATDLTGSSLIRWHEQLDSWILEDAAIESPSFSGEGFEWRRIETVPGVVAAARRVGQLEGHVLRAGKQLTAEERDTFFARLRAGRAIELLVLKDGLEFYAMRRNGGATEMTACFEPATGCISVWTVNPLSDAEVEAVAFLETTLTTPPPGQRP